MTDPRNRWHGMTPLRSRAHWRDGPLRFESCAHRVGLGPCGQCDPTVSTHAYAVYLGYRERDERLLARRVRRLDWHASAFGALAVLAFFALVAHWVWR